MQVGHPAVSGGAVGRTTVGGSPGPEGVAEANSGAEDAEAGVAVGAGAMPDWDGAGLVTGLPGGGSSDGVGCATHPTTRIAAAASTPMDARFT